MVSKLTNLLEITGASPDTLSRSMALGTIRAEKRGARGFVTVEGENLYLTKEWDLISRLRRGLRTEPTVGAAYLFGSHARNDAVDSSDIDLMIVPKFPKDIIWESCLARRLSNLLGGKVDLVIFSNLRKGEQLEIFEQGRLIVDRIDFRNRFKRAVPRLREAEKARNDGYSRFFEANK